MILSSAVLHPRVHEGDPELTPVRNGYGEGVLEAGRRDERVVVLTADLAESTRVEAFAHEFPKRFFEMGVAEQNMATVASGLALSGLIPFISSYAAFSPGRNWEQIRTTIAYNGANVKIAGHHAGISVGPDGATHQAIEDIATMRVMPTMRVVVPCDATEARRATLAAAEIEGPVYLRLAREKTALITTEETPFSLGRAEVFFRSSSPRILIAACGPLVFQALLAAQALDREGIGATVLNVHTVKPLDVETILREAAAVQAVISVEEHQVIGGLGGALAELFARELPRRMAFVGMQDTFGESGPPEALLSAYGMTAPSIASAARRLVAE